MADGFVEQTLTHPTNMADPRNATIVEDVRAMLQRQARERGASLADPEAEPEVSARVHLGILDTTEGPVEATTTTWRAAVVGQPEVPSDTVEAREQDPDVWVAAVPSGMPIISVRHGLDTYDVQVIAHDANHGRVGVHGFLPVSKNEVEVILPGGSPAVTVGIIRPTVEDVAADERQEAGARS